jgi:hypothetical protein
VLNGLIEDSALLPVHVTIPACKKCPTHVKQYSVF